MASPPTPRDSPVPAPGAALAELGWLLRPAGRGIHTVSTGRAAQEALAAEMYGAVTPAEVTAAWRGQLQRLPEATVVILGIPSDCGAGLVRGAAFGPQSLRQAWRRQRPDLLRDFPAVLDLGDVAVVPHLLHDEMLNEAQKRASRAALYPELGEADAARLPVSPLSIAERALDRVFDVNPNAKVLVLGGDHSVAEPVVAALKRRRAPALGVVQPDAHTDLLPERLGVRHCFATWAYHANDLLGRGGRLVQVGVRASSRTQQHWESTLGVRQYWAAEVLARGDALIDDIVAHLRSAGVKQLYFSNDIDATDAGLAPSTGAPEPAGLAPAFLVALLARLGRDFDLVGADLVEVAPPVGSAFDSEKTIAVGVAYLTAALAALLGRTA